MVEWIRRTGYPKFLRGCAVVFAALLVGLLCLLGALAILLNYAMDKADAAIDRLER